MYNGVGHGELRSLFVPEPAPSVDFATARLTRVGSVVWAASGWEREVAFDINGSNCGRGGGGNDGATKRQQQQEVAKA